MENRRSIQPLETQKVANVVQHIMHVGAKQARQDYEIDRLRASINGFGQEPTRLWNRGLGTAFTQYVHHHIAGPILNSDSPIHADIENDPPVLTNAEKRIVDDNFINQVSEYAYGIVDIISDAVKQDIENQHLENPGGPIDQLVQEWEDELAFRRSRGDSTARGAVKLISAGLGQSINEAILILKLAKDHFEKKGAELTADQASEIIIESFRPYIAPSLKVSAQEFERKREATQVPKKHYELGIIGFEDEPIIEAHNVTDEKVELSERLRGRLYPRGNSSPSFRDRQGCLAAYPPSLTNEFFPEEEVHNTNLPQVMNQKLADIVKRLRIPPSV